MVAGFLCNLLLGGSIPRTYQAKKKKNKQTNKDKMENKEKKGKKKKKGNAARAYIKLQLTSITLKVYDTT